MTPFEMVREFHEAFGHPVRSVPSVPDRKRKRLRRKLIREEYRELMRALRKGDLIGAADGAADLEVVICGTMLEYGIDLDAVFAEVHRSNMRKLGEDGKPIYRASDNKIRKPPNWQPPDIAGVLARQRENQ